MDRIDLQVTVSRLKPEEMTQTHEGEPSEAVRDRVLAARAIARDRFQGDSTLHCNAQMQTRHLRQWCRLDEGSRQMLEAAIQRLGLSARAMDRVLKVGRTIADLAGAKEIQVPHIAEAIQYRTLDRRV